MDVKKNKGGRPRLENGKRSEHIVVRFTEEENRQFSALALELGLSRSDLLRKKVLHDAELAVVNSMELIRQLDAVGAEMGRAGNNINQLARHANVLNGKNQLEPLVVSNFNALLSDYIGIQQDLQASLRKIIRMMHR